MTTLLDGRRALVTGAAQGIGLEIARVLVAHGARVVVADLDGERAAEAARSLGDQAIGAACNVTSEDDVQVAVDLAVSAFGGLDVLVNNAGITRDASLKKMTLDDFDAVITTHLRGTWLGIRAASAVMREAKSGSIVNISSMSGKVGNPGQTNYSAAKAGVVGMTKAAAKELAHHGVRVNAVMPGLIKTPMTAAMSDEAFAATAATIPMRRAGEPEEVANVVAFLASELASYMTGTVLEVSGGAGDVTAASTTTSQVVTTRIDGAVGYVTLDRSDAMNAITIELGQQLEQGLRHMGTQADVAVVVVRGAGGNFCAGGDFREVERLRAGGPVALRPLFEHFAAACRAAGEIRQPVVAAVEGVAMAGGFELLQACDLVIVCDEARLCDNHVNYGQVPGGGGSQRLPRLVGRQRALGHLLTGLRLSGADAVAMGLAFRSFPRIGFEAGLEELVTRIAGHRPEALAKIKRLVRTGLEGSLDDGLALELDTVVDHIAGDAGGAGVSAFSGRTAS